MRKDHKQNTQCKTKQKIHQNRAKNIQNIKKGLHTNRIAYTQQAIHNPSQTITNRKQTVQAHFANNMQPVRKQCVKMAQ